MVQLVRHCRSRGNRPMRGSAFYCGPEAPVELTSLPAANSISSAEGTSSSQTVESDMSETGAKPRKPSPFVPYAYPKNILEEAENAVKTKLDPKSSIPRPVPFPRTAKANKIDKANGSDESVHCLDSGVEDDIVNRHSSGYQANLPYTNLAEKELNRMDKSFKPLPFVHPENPEAFKNRSRMSVYF